MKLYKSSGKNENKSDRIFMLLFLIIFAMCFLPFLLKKENLHNNKEAIPVNVEENDISGPDMPEKITSVQDKPGIRLHYSETNLNGITDDDISSTAALLYDRKTNTVIYSKNADSPIFPASTTKIMTACVALRYLEPDYPLKVGTELSLLQPESSLAYLNQGNELTLEDALYALLLPSGNDAAYVIAVNTARFVSENPAMPDAEAVKYFGNLMNDEAFEAGADHTHFCVPDGYHDPFHYTTAEDMLKIAIHSEKYPLIAQVCAQPYRETKILSGQSFYWANGNLLVANDNGYYLPFATGLKTGFTDEAGYCMVATAADENNDLIAVVMKAPTLAERYTDAARLFYSVMNPEKLREPPFVTTEPAPEPPPEENAEGETPEDNNDIE